jgi:HEAT repeat protein
LVRCLKGEPESQVDSGLQLNAAAALSVLAQQEEGLGPIQDAEADSAIISALTSAKDAQVKEEVVDALCALSSHENMRSRIVQKGAVSQLACVIQDASPEVCVRTLLALGMLCGSRYSCLPMNYDEFLEKTCTSLC